MCVIKSIFLQITVTFIKNQHIRSDPLGEEENSNVLSFHFLYIKIQENSSKVSNPEIS